MLRVDGTSSSDIAEGRICGSAAEGGAYGDGRAGVCDDIVLPAGVAATVGGRWRETPLAVD